MDELMMEQRNKHNEKTEQSLWEIKLSKQFLQANSSQHNLRLEVKNNTSEFSISSKLNLSSKGKCYKLVY